MLRLVRQKFQKALALLSLIAIFLQFAAPTAALNAYQRSISFESGIIVVCRGFELIYLKLDDNGKYVEVEIDADSPIDQNVNHCDSCFSNQPPILYKSDIVTPRKIARIAPIFGPLNETPLNVHFERPAPRAPPHFI